MRPIIRIVIITVTSFVLVSILAIPLNNNILRYQHSYYKRFDPVFEAGPAYDVLFVGSSRTFRGINPYIIDSICHVNSFNAGKDAGHIPDFEMTIKGYLVNHPAPKLIVLTYDFTSFSTPNEIFNYPLYYPLIENPVIEQTFKKYGYSTFMIKIFPFLRVTLLDDFTKINGIKMLINHRYEGMDTNEYIYKGYLANSNLHMDKSNIEKTQKRVYVGAESVSELQEIINMCKAKGIKLIVLYQPEYRFNVEKSFSNSDSVINMITEMVNKDSVPYLRHDTLEMCTDSMLFHDRSHLNINGAKVYSAILAKELKPYLSK